MRTRILNSEDPYSVGSLIFRTATREEIVTALQDLLDQVRYLAPERFDDQAHAQTFHARLEGYQDLLDRIDPITNTIQERGIAHAD